MAKTATKKTETKIVKEEKEEDILTEFQSEVMDRKKKNVSAIFGILFFILVFFGLAGVAAYQIFYKPEQFGTDNNVQKIENVPPDDSAKTTPTPAPTPAPTPKPTPAPKPSYVTYTVQEGDTWSSVANDNGMTSAELMKYNGTSSEDLQIGEKIKIPN